MKKIFTLFIFSVLWLLSCQRELSFPAVAPVPPIIPEKLVAAIVITDSLQVDYDSVVYRYQADKIREVHFARSRDSITRSYYYDAAGRLSKIEDEKALYYTNNDVAKRISFQYDNSGLLIKTLTDFTTISAIPSTYNNILQGSNKKIIVYDTAYSGPFYNLDWANRVIYNTLTSDNYILYDSCVYNNKFSGVITTLVSSYTYDADKNVTAIDQATYVNNERVEEGITVLVKDSSAPVYEGLRKKLYRNLVNWYEASSVSQDDNYRFFTVPGHMYKSIVYGGYSVNIAAGAFKVTRSYDYKNTYTNDLLKRSVVTYSVHGQGSVHYSKVLRYYYQQ
jgi:hypothetical protein